MPRHFRGTTSKDLGDFAQGRAVALGPNAAGVLVLDLVPALFQLLHAMQHALQNIDRLETGDDDRHAVLLRRSGDTRPCR